MKFAFLTQFVLISVAACVNYKFPYIVYKTARRDVSALWNYSKFQLSLRRHSRADDSVADIFQKKVVQKNPHKVILIAEGTEWTAKQLNEHSNRVANVFKDAGLLKGDTVALMMNNRPEFVAIWLGLSKIGVVTALINVSLRQESLVHSVNIVNCSAFIFEVGLVAVEEIRKLSDRPSLQLYQWNSSEQNLPAGESWATPLAPALAQASITLASGVQKSGYKDELMYIYTSGTTGLPKAAVITNSRYVFMAGALSYQLGFRKTDRIYTPLPLYHSAGGAMAVGQALLYGSCVVIRKKFSASSYFADIRQYDCTIAQYIGEMCRYITLTPETSEDKNHKLRMMFGNGLRKEVWEVLVERFNVPRIGEFYGSTEGNANTINTDNKVGAIGFVSQICSRIYPISVIKIDPDTMKPVRNNKGLCVHCRAGEPGVIVGKISQSDPARAFPGYVDREESEKKVVGDVFAKGDSAFLSGDIVVFDVYGYLYFKDRLGDTFRWKGENVSTTEVETVIMKYTKLKDCVVYGVQIKGCEGRAGMAAMVIDENDPPDLVDLATHLNNALATYAVPIFIRYLSHVEQTGTFKMKKVDLQKQGFDPETVTDKMFYLTLAPNRQYEPLTSEVYQRIQSGSIRF